jgi:hypothetical protein
MRNGPYILVIAPEDYTGKKYRNRYVYEHHLVWWQNTNSVVPRGYVIHHKNHNKHDNRIENLELMTDEKHKDEHTKERKKSLIKIICFHCGKEGRKPGRNYRFALKKGKNRFYCSRNCQYAAMRKRSEVS